jgi:predicted aspartyl protease
MTRAAVTAALSLGASLVGCARKPTLVTQPAAVVIDTTARGHVPVPTTHPRRDYPNYWSAINDANFDAARTLAAGSEQQAFANALANLANGRLALAESTTVRLLHARDSVVQRAAHLTYGALLSARADWRALATFTRRDTAGSPADEAAAAVWATAFAQTATTSQFADSVAILPLVRTPSGAPVIPIRINGIVKQFWLDTGSSLTIIASSVARECGIEAIGTDTLEFLTAAGRIPARPAIVTSLHVGGFRVTQAPAMIVERSALTLRSGARLGGEETAIDGIIGFDVIRQLDLTIDDARGRVVIRRPALRAPDPRRPRNLFWFGLPIVSAVSDRGVALHLALDTGAEETYATLGFVRKTGAHVIRVERRIVNGFGGSITQRGFLVPSVPLTLGGRWLHLQRLFLYDAQYPTIFTLDGTLGADVARGAVMRIDMTNGRLDVGG